MYDWHAQAVVYHIYPLGFCGAPERNDFQATPTARLETITAQLDHIRDLGFNTLYLGPVFESSKHGYDTTDYFAVDRRLGTAEDLQRLAAMTREKGMRLILDGVFNHVGRDFPQFRDVQTCRQSSPFADWFANLRFDQNNHWGDGFTYEGWHGHDDLVKLNLRHPDVTEHLLAAVQWWLEMFNIDGLRLDAAECMDVEFLKTLARFCKSHKPDFILIGEAVHGDYRTWAGPDRLDGMTNYESYKGLHSSFNDGNMFEIGYALNRQFGPQGMYRELAMYNFTENHDVDRVASLLTQPAHLYPLHILLYTMPGIPSVYYGGEWGVIGKKHQGDDGPLRPDWKQSQALGQHRDLAETIRKLAAIRMACPALQKGNYAQVHVASEQLVFQRVDGKARVVVVINGAGQSQSLRLDLLGWPDGELTDLLNPGERFWVAGQRLMLAENHAYWGRILVC